eukprot:CAMPEP_0184687658 /NCGR_PEP_ID=MMETSP0312-20130426/27214_1 /TAXON_ID=31354 /ORGANISM="Compsopogon coeruleus, Strain SAG 36.94" /LENGTH=523 /DNA_ID=CAMNT_0027144035 /DNA_START=200 /DNA_END=1772 /DNA_ORIENTATION=+
MQAFAAEENMFPHRAVSTPKAFEFLFGNGGRGAEQRRVFRKEDGELDLRAVMDGAIVLGFSVGPKGPAFRHPSASIWNALGIIEGIHPSESGLDGGMQDRGRADPVCHYQIILLPEIYLDQNQRIIGGTLIFADHSSSFSANTILGTFVVNLDEPGELATSVSHDRLVSLSLSSEGIRGQRQWMLLPADENIKQGLWPKYVLAELIYQADCKFCQARNWPCTCSVATILNRTGALHMEKPKTWNEFRDLVHASGTTEARVSLSLVLPSRETKFVGASQDTIWHGGPDQEKLAEDLKRTYAQSKISGGTKFLDRHSSRQRSISAPLDTGVEHSRVAPQIISWCPDDNSSMNATEILNLQHISSSSIPPPMEPTTGDAPLPVQDKLSPPREAIQRAPTHDIESDREISQRFQSVPATYEQSNPDLVMSSIVDSIENTQVQGSTRTRTRYVCSFCLRNFARPGRLEQHVAVAHEGRTLFQCPRCPRSFPVVGNLNDMFEWSISEYEDISAPVAPPGFSTIVTLTIT